jgi:ferredoxin
MYYELSNSSLESASKLSFEELPFDPLSAELQQELDEAETDAWLCTMEAQYEAEQATKQRLAALSGRELFDWGIRNNGLRLTHQPHAHRCRACASVVLHGRGECPEPSHNTCPDCQQAINATLAAAYERNAERQWLPYCQQQARLRAAAVTRDGWEV